MKTISFVMEAEREREGFDVPLTVFHVVAYCVRACLNTTTTSQAGQQLTE